MLTQWLSVCDSQSHSISIIDNVVSAASASCANSQSPSPGSSESGMLEMGSRALNDKSLPYCSHDQDSLHH